MSIETIGNLAPQYIPQRKLLDLERYSHQKTYDIQSLANDLAATAIEVDKTKKPENRVWRVRIYQAENDSFLNWPNKVKDVRDQYSTKSEFDAKETYAGLEILKFLDEENVNEMFAWISPPTPQIEFYDETRLQIGVIKEKMGFKFIEYYGIPINLDAQNCLNLFHFIQHHSRSDTKPLNAKHPDELRSKIIRNVGCSSDSENWINFWKSILPAYSSIWESIENGSIEKNMRKVRIDARESVKSEAENIKYAAHHSPQTLIYEGARIEMHMMAKGHKIVSSSCGVSNMDLITQTQRLFSSFISVNPNEKSKDTWVWTNGNCIVPGCGKKNVDVGPCSVCRTCQEKDDAQKAA